jgi:hypothetical protein
MIGTPAAARASRVAITLRSPTLMPVPLTSCPNMLAPPAIFALTRALRVPSARISSSMRGTIVSGNFAGLVVSRDMAWLGSRMCASAPICVSRS